MALRWEEEDLDEYEDDEEGGEGEDEYEEEKDLPKPSKEEMEYLKMREKLKERIRQKHRKENGRSAPVPSRAKAEFGSFFGPSQPVIARRVIEESHSMRETQHITSKSPTSHSTSKRLPASVNMQQRVSAAKAFNDVKSKVETLKDLRDYSFLLSDDADIPAPKKDPPSRNSSIPRSDRALPKVNVPMVKTVRPEANSVRNLAKPGTSNLQKKAGILNACASGKLKPNGNPTVGSGQPSMHRSAPSSVPQSSSLKKHPASVPGQKLERRALPSKLDSSSKKQYPQQRSENQGLRKEITAPRRPMSSVVPQQSKPHRITTSAIPQHGKSQQPIQSSKPQPNKPSKPLERGVQVSKLKKKPVCRYSDEEDNGDGAINMIRQMFRYNPNKYRDDDDDSDMEANFDDIMAEENRSAWIAKKEDDEQLRLIEEEEERERMRKLAKKRKLSR